MAICPFPSIEIIPLVSSGGLAVLETIVSLDLARAVSQYDRSVLSWLIRISFLAILVDVLPHQLLVLSSIPILVVCSRMSMGESVRSIDPSAAAARSSLLQHCFAPLPNCHDLDASLTTNHASRRPCRMRCPMASLGVPRFEGVYPRVGRRCDFGRNAVGVGRNPSTWA